MRKSVEKSKYKKAIYTSRETEVDTHRVYFGVEKSKASVAGQADKSTSAI